VRIVIDWNIGKTNAFFDYGSSMTACFSLNGKKFYPKKLNEFISAYDKERPLTNWEKEHIFEALKFGILKYGIWGFVDLKTGDMVRNEKKLTRMN
jgi:Ser/Thr protein kinase RdoA (MazF antagonist)